MNTNEGVLVVTGENLHIGKLSLDGGELHVDGRIDAISFEDAPASRGGFLSRLLGAERWALRSRRRQRALPPPCCSAFPSRCSTICCAPCACGGASARSSRRARRAVLRHLCAARLPLFDARRRGELRLYMILAALLGALFYFSLCARLLRPLWDLWRACSSRCSRSYPSRCARRDGFMVNLPNFAKDTFFFPESGL